MGDLIFKAKAKLLIDGIDVPFTSASPGASGGDFTTCTFSIVATVHAFNIRFRSNVLLLVWDDNRKDYVAVFEGEIKTRGYSFSGSGAQCQFSARGLFTHYAKMMLYWQSGAASMYSGAPASTIIKIGSEETVVTGDLSQNATDASLYILQLSRMFGHDGQDFDIMKGLQMFLRSGYTNELNANPYLKGLVSKFYMTRGAYANMIPGMGKGSQRYIFEGFKSAEVFFQDKAAKSVFFRSLQNNMSPRTSRWDYFMYILSMIHHDAIMPLGSIKHGLIVKPNLYFAMPPACNVLFPNMVTSFNFSHNWEQSPTRLLTALNNGTWSQDGGIGHDIWYPLEVTNNLFDMFKDKGKSGAGRGEPISINGTTYNTIFETEEEKLYGYTSAYGTVDYSSVLGALLGAGSGTTPANGEEMKKQNDLTAKAVFKQFALMAKENMQQLKFGTSSGSFMCKYNPNLVPGFPMMLIFGPRNAQDSYPIAIVGYLNNVQHTVTPAGTLGTTGSISMTRPVWYKPQPEVPAWVGGSDSKIYSDSQIGSKVYKQFVGCTSACEVTKTPGANIEEAAKLLYKDYVKQVQDDSSGQKAEDWTRNITKRELDTLSTYVTFNDQAMELTAPVDPTVENNAVKLTGPLYTHVDGSRARVEEYVKYLKNNPVMAGI